MANPTTFDFCGRVMVSSWCSAAYLCEERSSKTSCAGGINQTVNAVLARRTVSLLTWWPSVCVSVRMPVSVCLTKLSDDVFTSQSSPFENLLIKYPQMSAQHIANLIMKHSRFFFQTCICSLYFDNIDHI